jgi:hypothetical protein
VKAIPKTRYRHLLLMKEPEDPLERIEHRSYGKTLERRYIDTLFFRNFADIEQFVCRIAAQAHRPIVGYSGTADEGLSPPGDLGSEQVEKFCKISAQALAMEDFRITSGHGPMVGVPAVAAAFDQNPTSARFYFRKGGESRYTRTAPAVVVPSAALEAMRERFISELDLLIAMGGRRTKEPTSGTVLEIKLALKQQVPVLIVPQAGGDAAGFAGELEASVRRAFTDASMADAICQANATIAKLSPSDLLTFAATDFPKMVGDLIARLMGAAMRRPRDALEGAPGSDW